MDGDDILVNWNIADGYYLYRDKMRFSAEGAELGVPVYPAGEIHSDEFFGEQIILRGSADVRIPLLRVPANSTKLELLIRSQGCADYGLCYPPQDWSASVDLPANRATTAQRFDTPTAVAGGKHSIARNARWQ